MFTGLIEELGSFVNNEGDRYFRSANGYPGHKIDDSISVNGCCLTIVAIEDGWWEADVVAETISRTSLGRLQPGDPVNLGAQ